MEINQESEDSIQFVDSKNEKEKVKKWIIIILVVAGGVLLYQAFLGGSGKNLMSTRGDEMKIEKGKNSFFGEVNGSYREDLRVYGIDESEDDGGWSPLGYVDYFLTASIWTGNTVDCERSDAMNAAIFNVIVEDESVRDKLEMLKGTEGRKRATITGREVRIKKFLFEGDDHSDSLKKQGKLDPGNALIVDEVKISN